MIDKRTIISVLFIIVVSCSANKAPLSRCKENVRFKESFMKNITIVDGYTKQQETGPQDGKLISAKKFMKSLRFIAEHTKIPVRDIFNFDVGYPSYETFNEDKRKWLEWYERHKCENLK